MPDEATVSLQLMFHVIFRLLTGTSPANFSSRKQWTIDLKILPWIFCVTVFLYE